MFKTDYSSVSFSLNSSLSPFITLVLCNTTQFFSYHLQRLCIRITSKVSNDTKQLPGINVFRYFMNETLIIASEKYLHFVSFMFSVDTKLVQFYNRLTSLFRVVCTTKCSLKCHLFENTCII